MSRRERVVDPSSRTEVESLLFQVERRWRSSGVQPRTGVGDAEIAAFERRFDVRLTRDVALYFRTIDGMDAEELDEHLIRFQSLDELRRARDEVPQESSGLTESDFVFAEWSLWVHGYTVRLSATDERVLLVGGGAPRQVAASFREFLATYLSRPDELF